MTDVVRGDGRSISFVTVLVAQPDPTKLESDVIV
jgi:hypothetical protein